MRRFLSILMALLMALCMVGAFAEATLSDDIVVLYTNDVHTYIDGPLSYDVIAAVKKDLQSQYKTVLLADAGDHLQGTAYGSMDKGETIIKLMNAAQYDLATLGNHEFDYGMLSALNAVENWANFPYVSCNFYTEEAGVRGENVLPSFVMFEAGAQKIAFVGVTTPETFTKSTPAYFQNEKGEYIYGIAGGEDGAALYADVQKAIDEAKAAGATVVIGLGHLGNDPASQPWTSQETIAAVSGLNAFIDGHSHTTMKGNLIADKSGANVLLTQTGEYVGRIGMMVIDAETGAITTDFIELVETEDADGNVTAINLQSELYKGAEVISDADVAAIKDAWMTEIDTQLGVKIGETALTLDNYDENGQRLVRSQETNTGDFCADALYYLFDNMGLDVDVAIMNGGGIRNKAVTGEISYKTAKTIHTFGNVACLQTITGQQLLDALEWGARGAGTGVEVGGFLQVSGITYTVDGTVADGTQKDEKGVWIGGPAEYRVRDVKVYNKETGAWDDLDLNAQYNMAGYNYTLRDLGDGFAMFDGAINVLDYVMEDYMVLANYVKAFEGGVIGATNSPLAAKYPGFAVDYGATSGTGRITVLAEAAEEAEDAPITLGGLENNVWFTKYGNIYVDCKAERFLGDMGFAQGDLVTVKFLNQELVLPVVPTYSYVDSGKPAVIVGLTETGAPTGYVSLAINMGNFGQTYGIATKNTDDAGNWFWTANEGVTFPVEFTFEMAEQGGYLAEYILHELNRTNNREDYAHLSDEAFANTRVIDTTGIGAGKLVRTSSPINPELGRSAYADAAIEAAGVTVIMNLADSEEMAKAYEGFADTYYAGQKVIYLNLGVDFAEPSFQEGLAKGLRFFAENEGVYAVHCTEGKDRAGFVSALLSCLMGGTYGEVVGDYMETYVNYYGVENETEKYNAIAESNIIKTLQNAFGVEDLPKADLAAEAAEYLAQIGLTEAEIAALKANLAPAYTETVVFIAAGDHEIPATVTVPAGEGPFPAVVMLHGNGSTRHEAGNAYDYTAPEMAKAGIATIRFDYIGNGDSTSDYIDFTYDKGVEDAMVCYEYLKTLGCIDMSRVGIMGWSQGGRLALLTAGRNEVFSSVLTWAGAYDQKLGEDEQYKIALEKGYFEVTYDWREPLKQSPAYYECAMNIDYPAEVAKIKAPLLAINGANDTTVLPEVAQKIVDAAVNSADAQVMILEGADHTFNVFTGDLTVLENLTIETINWFGKTL